jgi:hypothetical protein
MQVLEWLDLSVPESEPKPAAPAPEIQNEANPAPARISPVPRRVPPTPQPTRRPVLPVSRFQYPLLRCLSPHRPPAPPALKLLPPAPTPRLAPPAAFRPITRAIPSRKLLAAPREPVDPALSWMSYLGLRTPRTPDPDMDRPLIEPFWPCAGFLDFPRHEVDLTSLSAPPNCLSREEVTSGLRAHGRAEVTKALDVRRPTTCFR